MVRKLVLSLIAVLGGGMLLAMAQKQQVSGTVTNADGNPIVGATVVVDGTTTGTTTNAAGQFSLQARSDGYLNVSFIGYESQKVPIAGKTTVNIQLKEDITAIDDVLVVAFGTTKKEAFTGSASVIKSEDLQKRQTTNVMNALVGSVAGLQMRGGSGTPGSDSGSINIRGISSMYADTDPLIIVDGAPYSASLSNIPQSDIESVTVLKDAASAALYGARGASGVIIVTTKRSQARDAVINVDMKWGVNSRAVQDYDVITDPGEYYEAVYAQYYNRYFYGQGMNATTANAQANTDMLKALAYDVYTRPDGENLIGLDGKLNPNATLGRKVSFNGTDYWMQPDDWTDAAYKNSLRQEYNVSVNGGTDKATYYTSVGYLNEDGIVDNSGYERISARIKADYQAKKWLKLGANVGYIHSSQDLDVGLGTSTYTNNLFYYTSRIAPIYPIYVRTIGADGKIGIKRDQYGNKAYDYGVAETGYGVTRPFSPQGNPLGEARYNNYTSIGNQLNGTFTADFDITDFLKVNVTSTATWGETYISNFRNMYYGTSAGTNGSIEKTVQSSLRTNNIQTITYYDSFGLHNINVLAGHEYYNVKTRNLAASKNGMFSPDIQELSAAATLADASSYTTHYNVEGYFLSAQYDYNGKYYGSFSYRRDGSSRFAPGHQWGNFWSVGAAWILSKENFLANAKWIDMLKLKASIGQQGNDLIGDYYYTDLYSLSKVDEKSMSASFAIQGNPDITWETTTNLNVGVEFSFWRGRLSGGIDVYRKKTTDLLFWLSLPESVGTRGIYGNLGDIRNSGIEINLTGTLIQTKTVDWSISANLAHNSTKILSLPASKLTKTASGKIGFQEAPTQFVPYWYEVGGPLYNAYLPVYAGTDEYGQAMFYKDVIEDGKVVGRTTTYDFNDATEYEHGSVLPKVFGGFGTNLRVGDFDLSLTFDYQIGGKVFDAGYAGLITPETGAAGGTAIHKDWKKSWSPNNTDSDMPRWQQGDQYGGAKSDRFLTDASYLNFQSFSLGYTIPERVFRDKVKVRIYAAGENLWFWSARKGLDPRYSFEGTASTGVSPYSPIRTISGGVQLTF
ncbi:SusC/RagA family TonB-linked outer membrane protein [uncultured Alistipes sp.]|uniref:SusC/RagA family TonB-linked outer membrane protein n=1 Tax=uncultured Alistipes sp. TaxID=538949 RepID=UPI00266CC952|nr:SusC/RagA family TonB-linked outer membrane protein [uncultured Alistipes sp.]